MGEMPRKLSKSDILFFHGVLAALYVCKRSGPTTLFDEIVEACGREFLVLAARRSGQMRQSGMSDYLRRQRGGAQ